MAAHVATDDKTELARIVELASAPPLSDPGARLAASSHAGLSVPEWRDEELSDFSESPPRADSASRPARADAALGRSTDAGVSLAQSPFPAPPAHGKLGASAFYDYPAAFEEDVVTVDGAVGPSAPPFEATPGAPLPHDGPSAPSFEDVPLAPSAPPLDGDTIGPSAPVLPSFDEGNDQRSLEGSAPPENSTSAMDGRAIMSATAETLPSYRRN